MPLTITIPAREYYDSVNNLFMESKEQTITIEHSLLSIAKWEAKWKKPFLTEAKKTTEEMIDYIRCMTITKNVDSMTYYSLTPASFTLIQNYINDPMTATTFGEDKEKQKKSKKIITSEELYYQMAAFQIPFECEKWHFNRLLTLLRIASIKNAPPKKMGKKSIMNRNRSLNEARKKSMNTNG